MAALMFVGIAQALFLCLLIGNKSSKKGFDYLLIIWLLLNCCNLLFYYFVFAGTADNMISWLIPLGLIPFAATPTLYLYTRLLVSKSRLSAIEVIGCYSSFLICNIFLYQDYFNDKVSLSLSQGFFDFQGPASFFSRYWALIMAAVHILFIVASLVLLFRHKHRIKQEFSYDEQINLGWLRNWLVYSVPVFFISFSLVWVGVFGFIQMIEVFYGMSGFISVNIFVIGYFGLKQTTIFTGKHLSEPETNVELREPQTVNSLETKALKVETYLNESQAYINPQLTLAELADGTGLPRNQLSAVINQYYGQNFFEYINSKRVDEFKQRVRDSSYSHLTLLGIAMDCGFNSKSSFNHIFKKTTGLTPGEYKKQHKS
ncbi:MAG: helix-turn-helix domain-containing protein [Bacteroidota bacterium]